MSIMFKDSGVIWVIDPGPPIAAGQSARLARVQQNQRLLGLDAVRDPVLETPLINREFLQSFRICSALVVLGNEIKRPWCE